MKLIITIWFILLGIDAFCQKNYALNNDSVFVVRIDPKADSALSINAKDNYYIFNKQTYEQYINNMKIIEVYFPKLKLSIASERAINQQKDDLNKKTIEDLNKIFDDVHFKSLEITKKITTELDEVKKSIDLSIEDINGAKDDLKKATRKVKTARILANIQNITTSTAGVIVLIYVLPKLFTFK